MNIEDAITFTDYRHSPAKIRAVREQSGLTVPEAAALAGMRPQRWTGIEAGRVNPSAETLRKMCRVLKCPPVDLLK